MSCQYNISINISPGHPPKLPLRADVGPGPEDDEEVFLARHLDEARQIEEGREVAAALSKVKHPFLRLVQVPGDVTAINALSRLKSCCDANLNLRINENGIIL